MTRKELPARAANIQRAISSTTTCTPATVESLRSFLLPTELPVLHSKTGSVQDGARNVRAMPRSKATGLKTKKGPVVAVLEVAAEEDQIQKREKIQLATEVVNGVLKGLSEAIKRPPLQKRTAPLRRTSSNISGIGSRSHTPLQPLSVNSLSSTSSQKGHSRRSSSTGLPDERLVGLRAQAECGRIAFATLRLMYGQKGSPKIPPMQLESGMSALIGRMITLGFEDLAMKELRILRRRLEGYSCSSSEQRVVQSTDPQKRREQTEAKVEALADLLHYSDLHAQGQLLALIVTTQLQTIKIITSKKESLLTQSAVRHLALNAPYSPANMIQRQVKSESPASRDKAAQQLESLAQSLINLCPSISSAQDRTMSKSTDNVSPDTAFELQLLALRIRLIWWELAGHCVNLTTEIIQPFYQYLSAFRRRSRTDQITKYMSAKAAFGIIAGKLQNITGTQETSSLAVYHVLADLAQESDQYHEAIDWIRKSRDCGQDHGPSQTRICNLDCRIATLHLRTLDSGINEAIPNALMSAMISLSGNLQGESTELDELLVSVVSLRRSSFAIFQKAHTPSNSDPGQGPSSLSFQCSQLVLLCLKFVLRYVGSGSSDYENEVKTARRDRRRQLAARVSNPIIESVAVMARFSARTTPTAWAKLDAGLQDCRALAVAIEDIDANDRQVSSENKQAFLSFVSISNAYWCRYLYLNQRPVDSKASRDCLRTCIDLIRDRPSPEKVAGLMSLKLEKYARACEVMRDYGRAAEVYEEALYAQVHLGLLKNAGEAAEFRSMPDALDSDTELGALTRVLIAYPRTAAKAKAQGRSVRPFLDIETLCACERGVLLEQQLIALLSMYDELERSSTTSSGFQNLAKTLLSIYTRDLYPVRRLRIIVRLMRLTYSTSELLDEDLRELVQQPFCIPGNTHLDMKLVQFLPHLTKCQEVLESLGQNALDVKGLERIMATWSKLPHEFPCWDLLRMQIYDMLDWLSLLESVAEYLDMQGLERTRVSVLHVLVTIHEAASSTQCSTLISKLSALGLQYARLGYSGIAGVVLRKAQRFLDSSEVPVNVALGWQLTYAEHALYIGDLKACEENLNKAQTVFNDRTADEERQKTKSKDQRRRSMSIAHAYYVHSLLAAAEGQWMKALHLGRMSVKSYQRSWAVLERSKGRENDHTGKDPIVHDEIVEAISELSITEHQPAETKKQAHKGTFGAAFWSVAPRLIRGLVHLGHMFARHGLLPEVKYYLGQAREIAHTVKATSFMGQHSSLLGQYLVCSGNLQEGLSNLENAEMTLSSIPPDQHYAQLQLSMANAYVDHGIGRNGLSAFDIAEHTLRTLMMKSVLADLTHQPSASEELDLQLRDLSLQEKKPMRKPQTKAQQAKPIKKATKASAQQEATQCIPEEIPASEAIVLSRFKSDIQRGRIQAAFNEGNLGSANTLLDEAVSLPCDQQGSVLQALLASRIRLRQGIEQLVSNPVFCVLQESTIAYPSTKAGSERLQHKKSPCRQQNAARAAPARTQRAKPLATRPRARSPQCSFETNLLDLAQTSLNGVFKLALARSTTSTMHEVTKVLGKILIILSATSSCASNYPVSSIFMAYVLEIGRLLSMAREAMTIQAEGNLSQQKITYDWPGQDLDNFDGSTQPLRNLDFATFQADYINIIPSTWTAVSMTLSESQEEILICKIRAGQSPLVLRLPLSRPNSLESEEESFGFDEGKAELQDIIRLANESTHGAQDLSHKGAKTQWWEARTALDSRLKDLLTNIERIWLGGFRGIFFHEAQDLGLLARLQQSLQIILDKHLPSRQKTGRKHQPSHVEFDQRIVELFVGLGCPSETYDIDEPLMDLLYFIVDILQFNGERNAYDEIDFDSIAIETTDALRQFHHALYDKGTERQEQHTILVLDKHLHCFPWESLPCLSGRAVSRLPSLGCLRDRILLQQQDKEGQDSLPSFGDRINVNRNNGASVLNPGSDLKNTQSKFEGPLQNLPGWETLVQKEPTESELKALLENREVLLYFGHGSGSQYIRSRTIKRLERCAVALLMGCSSGALTEAGDFESYGTPMNYMHGGSSAVLATLWDVTDKDIDRFSQTVLEEWGLFEKSQPPVASSPVKQSVKQKAKSKVNNIQEARNEGKLAVSLDEAVARGRDSCILKYLNGAAPVVYGVPVFLS